MLYCWCHILWKENKGSEAVGLLKPVLKWQCHVHVVRLCPIRPLPLGYNTRPLWVCWSSLAWLGLHGASSCTGIDVAGSSLEPPGEKERGSWEGPTSGPVPTTSMVSALTSSPYSNFLSPIISPSIPSSSPNLFCPPLTSHFLCSAFLSSLLSHLLFPFL